MQQFMGLLRKGRGVGKPGDTTTFGQAWQASVEHLPLPVSDLTTGAPAARCLREGCFARCKMPVQQALASLARMLQENIRRIL